MRASSAGQPAGAPCVVDAAQGAQLLADQRPGGVLLVGRVDLGQRLAGVLVGDALAAQLLGQRAPGQAAACAAGSRPTPARRPRRRPARPPRTGRAAGPRRRRARRAWPACRPAPCGCGPDRSAGRAGSCARPPPGRRRPPEAAALRRLDGLAARRPPSRSLTSPGVRAPRGLDRGPRLRRRQRRRPRVEARVGAASPAPTLQRLSPTAPHHGRHARGQSLRSYRHRWARRIEVVAGSLSTCGPTPSFSRIFFSSSLARSGLSLRNLREFSLPWPSWSPS